MPKRAFLGKSDGRKRTEELSRAFEGPYRLLFEKNPQSMWVYDVETLAFLAVNSAAVEQYGYSSNEFMGMTIRDIRAAHDIPALSDIVCREGGGLERSTECRHHKKDGSVIDVEITSSELTWSGRSARLVLATDITRRKQKEERLKQSEESYRQFVEQSPDAVLVHRKGEILFANMACVSLFGASSAPELAGKQMFDFIHPDDREGVKKRIREYDRDFTNVRHNETRLIGLNGKETYTEVVACSINFLGKPAMQVAYRDISQRKLAEKRLQESEANLAAAQRIARLGSWERDLIDVENWANNPLRWSDEVFEFSATALARLRFREPISSAPFTPMTEIAFAKSCQRPFARGSRTKPITESYCPTAICAIFARRPTLFSMRRPESR